jgi:hypothetical protein
VDVHAGGGRWETSIPVLAPMYNTLHVGSV